MSKVQVVVCPCCGDLYNYSGCTYEEAMDIVCFPERHADVEIKVDKYIRNCGQCR